MRLVINGKDIQLKSGTEIKQTKQVNDIGNIKTRQANLTRGFTVLKTPQNVAALDFLSNAGNQSNVPYQRNSGYVYSDSGELLIDNGWAVVKSTAKEYKIHIYDGIIDFYKAIENDVLTDVGLADLTHLKNLNNVIATWNDYTIPYRYIVADYNGKSVYDTNKINIDYLIPSVNVKWLWDKIFDYYGWTYTGSVFLTQDFINLWITYPKTINDSTAATDDVFDTIWRKAVKFFNTDPNNLTIFHDTSLTASLGGSPMNNQYVTGSSYMTGGFPISAPDAPVVNSSFTVNETGLYRFRISGTIYHPTATTCEIEIYHGVQVLGTPLPTQSIGTITYGQYFDFNFDLSLIAGETFRMGSVNLQNALGNIPDGIIVDIDYVTGNQVDFEEAFIDFKVSDFLNEVLWRFGLTPFTDSRNKTIDFLNYREWFQTTDIMDWSASNQKYVQDVNEKYIIGSYAQVNRLSYKYNDKEAHYNDGFIYVNNKNLKDETSLIKSKIHSPEQRRNALNFGDFNVYKFWEKEVKDDGAVDYKDKQNRFYFLRSEDYTGNHIVGSEFSGVEQSVVGFPRENFERLSFSQIVTDYYSSIYSILNKAKLYVKKIRLTDIDISRFDFRKLAFIKELSNYFLINKIPNYTKSDVYNVELIEVDYGSDQADGGIVYPPTIILNSIIYDANPPFSFSGGINSQYSFLNYVPISATITAKQLVGVAGSAYTGTVLTDTIDINNNVQNFVFPIVITALEAGWYELQIEDSNGLLSNIQYVYIAETGVVNNPFIAFNVQPQTPGQPNNPLTRDLFFRWNHFTPASANITIQRWNWLGGFGIGAIQTITITASQLTQDTDHIISNVLLGGATNNLWFRVVITTDTLVETRTIFVL